MLELELGPKEGTMFEVLQKMNSNILSKKDLLAEKLSRKFSGITIFQRIAELNQDRSKSLKVQKAL